MNLRVDIFEKELKKELEDKEKHVSRLERELQKKVNVLEEIERKLKGKDDNTKSTVDDSTISALSKISCGPYLIPLHLVTKLRLFLDH